MIMLEVKVFLNFQFESLLKLHIFGLFSSKGLLLRAWVDITSGKDSHAKKSIKLFDEALSG